MDHQSQAEAFEVLPPATAQNESCNEYENEQPFPPAQGEFEDEVYRDHRRGGAPVHAAWGGHRPSAPPDHRARASVQRWSRPGVHSVYRTHNMYAPQGPSALFGVGGARYGSPGYYGASGSYGTQPWNSGGQWGRWPRWHRSRWPNQGWGWGWDAGGVSGPDGDDDYPPQPMPAMVLPPPYMPPYMPPDPPPAAAFAPATAPTPAPADPAAAPPAGTGPGASSEFEFEYGFGPGRRDRSRGRGHHPGCGCGSCRGGSSFGGFAQEYEQEVAGGPSAAKPACAHYTPGEVQRSTSAEGLLRASVFEHPRGTVVADFGVNWRTPRDSLAKDPALAMRLRQWLEIARSDASLRMRVLGFSDCVGVEGDNLVLRKGRATRLVTLLERMVGKPAFDALRPRIVTIDAAPIGEFLGTNDTIEGRAINRGVLFEFQRQVQGDPMTVTACSPSFADRLRYPLLRLVPNVPDYRPLPIEFRIDAKKMVGDLAQDLHGLGEKAHVLMEAAHWGIAAADIFDLLAAGSALAGALAVVGPVLAWASGFVAMGAPYLEASREIGARHAATGFSIGLTMAASGASFRKMKEYFGYTYFKQDDYTAVAKANYLAGLVAGFAQGRALCPAQRAVVMRDIGKRMGRQPDQGKPADWSDKQRIDWFVSAAATFSAAHLEH